MEVKKIFEINKGYDSSGTPQWIRDIAINEQKDLFAITIAGYDLNDRDYNTFIYDIHSGETIHRHGNVYLDSQNDLYFSSNGEYLLIRTEPDSYEDTFYKDKHIFSIDTNTWEVIHFKYPYLIGRSSHDSEEDLTLLGMDIENRYLIFSLTSDEDCTESQYGSKYTNSIIFIDNNKLLSKCKDDEVYVEEADATLEPMYGKDDLINISEKTLKISEENYNPLSFSSELFGNTIISCSKDGFQPNCNVNLIDTINLTSRYEIKVTSSEQYSIFYKWFDYHIYSDQFVTLIKIYEDFILSIYKSGELFEQFTIPISDLDSVGIPKKIKIINESTVLIFFEYGSISCYTIVKQKYTEIYRQEDYIFYNWSRFHPLTGMTSGRGRYNLGAINYSLKNNLIILAIGGVIQVLKLDF